MTIVWMGRKRFELKIVAALVIAATIMLALVMLFVDVPAPQAFACTTSHTPGGDSCLQLTCGSVVKPSMPATFTRMQGASPSAAQTCSAARRVNLFGALGIAVAGAAVGLVLIKQSSRPTSKDIEKPTIET